MATKSVERILRVGVIQNGRIIEERLLTSKQPVTVGQKLKNTFVIASNKFPAQHTLFDVKSGGYQLVITDSMEGRVQVGDQVYDMTQLKQSGKAKKASGGYAIEINDRSRGKVSIGDVTLLFQFVTPPPLRALPQLPANMRGGFLLFMATVMGLSGGFLTSLVFSFVLQVGATLWLVYMVPSAPRSRGLEDLPDRFVQILSEEPEAPDEPPPTDLDDAEDGEVVEEPEAEVEVVAQREEPQQEQAEQAPAEQETRTRDEVREEAQQIVRTESALAAFYGGADDATGPTLGFTDSLTDRTAEEVLANQTALGENAGVGIVSNSGIGTSSGAEGEVRRAQVDSGGSSVAANAETTRTERAEAPAPTPRVRAQSEQVRGSGSIDSDNLRSVLRRRQRDITRCYERALAQDPGLRGRITIQFTVGSDGSVSDARLPDNEVGSSAGNCILGRVRRWRFEPPSGGTVTVRRPYLLEPSGG
ncbi:MAG: TonB family protein [Bradymonadia bacterium]|jgi:TonB family protein